MIGLKQRFMIYQIKFGEYNPHDKAKELHCFMKSDLTCFNQDTCRKDNEDLLFQLIAQIPTIFETFVTPIPNISECENSRNAAKEIMNVNLQSAAVCLESLQLYLGFLKTEEDPLCVLQIILNVLIQAYGHCKDSEVIYGELLEDFVSHLGSFFKKVENLQMAMLLKFEHMLSLPNSEDVSEIYSISVDIAKLCQLVTTMDALMAFKLWTIYIKFIAKYKETIHQKLDDDSVMTFLAVDTAEVAKQCMMNLAKEDAEDKVLCTKICFFQVNVIVNIFDVFSGFLKESVYHLKLLALQLYDLLISYYSPLTVDKDSWKLLGGSLLNSVLNLISALCLDKTFCKSVLRLPFEETRGFQIPVFLLKLAAISFQKIAETETAEMYFVGILSTLQANIPEDDLKLVCVHIPHSAFNKNCHSLDKNTEYISIYDYAYATLSSYSKELPDSYFLSIINILLKLLISSSDVVSLLISDVCVYRLRCSSTEFLYSCCSAVIELRFKFESPNSKVENLLKRMIKFLPHNYKKCLLEQNEKLRVAVCTDMKVQHRYGVPQLFESRAQKDNVYNKVSTLMSILKETTSDDIDLIHRACQCLELCSLFVYVSENIEQLLKFIEFASRMFKSGIYEVQVAVLTFVKSLSKKSIPDKSAGYEAVVGSLAELFGEALKCNDYIIRCQAFDTFAEFAQSTPHPKIIQETVKKAPNLKTAIKSFFTVAPLDGFLSEEAHMEMSLKQLSMYNNMPQNVLSDTSKNILSVILQNSRD